MEERSGLLLKEIGLMANSEDHTENDICHIKSKSLLKERYHSLVGHFGMYASDRILGMKLRPSYLRGTFVTLATGGLTTVPSRV